ncbi:unnamed protein product [Trichobilharzia regenti]|nr:unnamed protein product [Trichobilharzia regenti]
MQFSQYNISFFFRFFRLSDFGKAVGERMVDVVYARDKPQKRDIRLYNALIFLKSNFWKSIFGKEADELERDGVDENIFYMIEHEPLVNRFTRFTYEDKDEKRKTATPLNVAAFSAGVVEAFLSNIGFVSCYCCCFLFIVVISYKYKTWALWW